MPNTIENVLILQGGGSLGAFGCGVFKALANSNIKIDIIAGTSIGGLNASIIAGSNAKEHPEKQLEQYWLELAETINTNLKPTSIESLVEYPIPVSVTDPSAITRISQVKSLMSFYSEHFLEIKRSLYQDGGLNSHLRILSISHRISGHICMITRL